MSEKAYKRMQQPLSECSEEEEEEALQKPSIWVGDIEEEDTNVEEKVALSIKTPSISVCKLYIHA